LTVAWVAAAVEVVAADTWAAPAAVSPSTPARTAIPAAERCRLELGRLELERRQRLGLVRVPAPSGRALSPGAILLRLNLISSPFLCVAPALPPFRRQHLSLETRLQEF
jgi:hypothetical protein